MKFISLFFTFFIILFVQLRASENQESSYQRFLKNYEIQETSDTKKVFFILDNDWILTSEVSWFDEHKLYSLHKLLNSRVLIKTELELPGLEITFENPNKRGYDKISFQAAIAKETYESSLVITNVQIQDNFWAGSSATIILSDDSKWDVPTWSGFYFVQGYYTLGDHVLLTQHYDGSDLYSLVNLDVSKRYYFTYSKVGSHVYPNEEPRSIEVRPLPLE
jgi:hypothetical protein